MGSSANFHKLTERKFTQINGRSPEAMDKKVGEALAPPTLFLTRTGELLGQCYCAGDDIGFQLIKFSGQFSGGATYLGKPYTVVLKCTKVYTTGK